MSKIGIAVSTLNQLALDFQGNFLRIVKSIEYSIEKGASIRIGPELEISGYSCEDAFFEEDTVIHSWQVLAKILKNNYENIILDIGMPITKDTSLYNCRVLILNKKIIAIRPKTILANNGNYRETRWFTPWTDSKNIFWFKLPAFIKEITNQDYVPFGSNLVLEINLKENPEYLNLNTDTCIRIGFEICEELWNPNSENINLFYNRGCSLVCNSSASYWEIRKLNKTLDLIRMSTSKCGGVYAYSNSIGCDGGRLCFYGRSIVVSNGNIICKTTDINEIFKEVDVKVAFVDFLEINAYRKQNNIKVQAHLGNGTLLKFDPKKGFDLKDFPDMQTLTIFIDNFDLIKKSYKTDNIIKDLCLKPEEEIFCFASLWLWDYLRKSKFAKGFIVPLSGGLDSCSVALIVYSICTLLQSQLILPEVKSSLKNILELEESEFDKKSKDINFCQFICSKLLRCVYLKTEYSSFESESRAQNLAKLISAEFASLNFSETYRNINQLGLSVNFNKNNLNDENTETVSILQQNLQARIRMLLTYFLSSGNRLVLATGNVDEALVGYLTKYDCSAADLNPIGSLSKQDLRRFIAFIREKFFSNSIEIINSILNAIPSAELSGVDQKDEDEIGLTYEELSWLGSLRKSDKGSYGPYGMFCKILAEKDNPNFKLNNESIKFSDNVNEIAFKIKRFFTLYSRNRHKQTTLTPALHAVTYSPDDNRFDHRQFLYNTNWDWQFNCIDEHILNLKKQI